MTRLHLRPRYEYGLPWPLRAGRQRAFTLYVPASLRIYLTTCVYGSMVSGMDVHADRCPVCGYPGDLGPSDHEAWCPVFMAGSIDVEGQLQLEDHNDS